MTTVKRYIEVAGRRMAVWLTFGDVRPMVEFAGGEGPQFVADADDYAYTHGGAAYQAACELAWELEDAGQVPARATP